VLDWPGMPVASGVKSGSAPRLVLRSREKLTQATLCQVTVTLVPEGDPDGRRSTESALVGSVRQPHSCWVLWPSPSGSVASAEKFTVWDARGASQ